MKTMSASCWRRRGRPTRSLDVRRWFNVYIFGGQELRNPWSVLSFAQQGVPVDYWRAM
ncbi:MAG: hypothetical protein IPI35_23510 [Deltaproteobacteria bacterium]|nr:hypothetical protein [Deltaproteobacteria bacterium]